MVLRFTSIIYLANNSSVLYIVVHGRKNFIEYIWEVFVVQ